jgi:threonine synthase
LKAIDGCYSMAKCLSMGYERVVFESGGNTGTALTEYGSHAGIETYCFVPRENLSLLDSATFRNPLAHLIAVEKPGRVKKAAHLFARLNGIRRVPETAWRYQASQFRGFRILEHIVRVQRFDWLVQTVSAAFGPIGIYRVLDRFRDDAGPSPRLLGIQQEANCPMYRAWKSGSAYVVPDTVDSTEKLLSRVMYDSAPHTYGTFEDLKDVLVRSRGDLITINHEEFAALLGTDLDGATVLQRLQAHAIPVTERSVEQTGLIALAGTFKQIRAGVIAPGSHVLCCITSGARHPDGAPVPYAALPSTRDARARGKGRA